MLLQKTAFKNVLGKEYSKYVIPPKEIDKLGEKRDGLVSEIKNRELMLRKIC